MSLDITLAKLKSRIEPFYYCIDETSFFSKHFLDELKSRFLKKATPENFKRVYAKDLNLDEIGDSLKTISMFSAKRVWVCEDSQQLNKRDVSFWIDIINGDASTDSCIVFLASKKTSNALVSLCQKSARLIEFKKPYDSQIATWVVWMAKRNGKSIDPYAIRLLVEKKGNDLMELQSEIEKLTLYVGIKPMIEEEDIREVLYATRSHSIFELLNAIGKKEQSTVHRIFHRMREEGESEVFIFSMALKHLRNIWKSIEWMHDRSESEIQKELGIHSFFWNDFRKQRDLHMKTDFERHWILANQVDLGLKTQSMNKADLVLGWLINTLGK